MAKKPSLEGTQQEGNHKQTKPFFGKSAGNLYFGVELELESEGDYPFTSSGDHCPNDCDECYDGGCCDEREALMDERQGISKDVVEILGKDWVSVCGDGSLDNGIEIKTAPSSLAIHRTRWQPLFENWPEDLQPYDNCGIHIHASSDFLDSEDQENKLYYLVYEPSHYEYITTIAGRGENSWCAYDPLVNEDQQRITVKTHDLGTTNIPVITKSTKYSAIHKLRHTYEFRMFPSTDVYEKLIANVEFVRTMMRYAKLPDTTVSLDNFIEYMYKTSRDHPFLAKRLKDLGLVWQRSFSFSAGA